MASYFFGASQQDDPPPYTEQHNLSQPMLIDEPEPSSSWIPFESFDIYTAQPLSDPLDPTLFAPEPIRQTSEIFAQTHPSLIEEQSTPISISPAMLDKSSTTQKEVIWYSSGAGKQIGGKKPPRHTGQGQGKGKKLNQSKPIVQKVLGPQYEVTVNTGLDTVKRIKLLFRDDSSVEPRSTSESQSALEVSDTPGKRIKWFERRVTPPAAIMSGQPIPNARDLHLDDNTPPSSPAPASPMREVLANVIVLEKKIEKDLYPVFLAKDARQVMIRSKKTGRVKGIIYAWG
jgi:hypothetical protein